jgi:capsular polysaccharide biosynthesis protein
MTDSSLPRVYSPAELETRNLILHVRSRRWRYLIIAIIMGIYFFWFFRFKILEYSSTATFIVNDRTLMATALGLESISIDETFSRIFELSNSNQTQTHLIKKFKLLEQYGIDTTKEFYMQKAIATIRSKISVAKSPMNTISITVRDPHRYLAADMANEIVAFIEKSNHDYFVNIVQSRLKLSQGYTNQLEKQNNEKIVAIDSVIKKLNDFVLRSNAKESVNSEILANQQRLSAIIGGFSNSTNELLNVQKMYALSLQALNFQDYPTTTVVQQAMPAFRSINYSAALYSGGAMIAVCLLLVVQAYFFMSYKHYITLLLTGR